MAEQNGDVPILSIMTWYGILHISIYFMVPRIFMSSNSEKCELTSQNSSTH